MRVNNNLITIELVNDERIREIINSDYKNDTTRSTNVSLTRESSEGMSFS